MPSVRCPSCDTAQHVEAGASGYTCSSCGKEWGFVVCRSCGARFHRKPGATTWTCPRCGLLQEATSEPPPETVPEPAAPLLITDADLDKPTEPPGQAFPPGLGLGTDDEGPQDAFAMPVRESTGRPIWIYALAAVALVVVLVLLFNLLFGGDNDGGGDATPSDGGAQVSGEEATATMCSHVQQMQTYRDDALGAAAEQLEEDAAALKQAGERQTAKQVKALIAAIDDARAALANQDDTAEPFAALRVAIADLPC
jgi:predicted RNA-binding Zn-ribbon protein involved in translation (DUF1610 family)